MTPAPSIRWTHTTTKQASLWVWTSVGKNYSVFNIHMTPTPIPLNALIRLPNRQVYGSEPLLDKTIQYSIFIWHLPPFHCWSYAPTKQASLWAQTSVGQNYSVFNTHMTPAPFLLDELMHLPNRQVYGSKAPLVKTIQYSIFIWPLPPFY